MREKIISEIIDERLRQEKKFGGDQHDDNKVFSIWFEHISDWNGWSRAMYSLGGEEGRKRCRRRLIQVAALALAAVESMDRRVNDQIKKDVIEEVSLGDGGVDD